MQIVGEVTDHEEINCVQGYINRTTDEGHRLQRGDNEWINCVEGYINKTTDEGHIDHYVIL